MPEPIEARFFDGQSGAAQAARVTLGPESLVIETAGAARAWRYREIVLAAKTATEIRLSSRREAEALLVLPRSAEGALSDVMPKLLTGERERARMAALILALLLATGAIGGFLFFGVPALSGPLAKATPRDIETQMGENLAAQINLLLKRCEAGDAEAALGAVIDDLATRADAGFPIRFQFVREETPNAFALPGGQVMATRGLLDAMGDDQEAFLAVLAHEIGHVRERDGMQAIYRNAGLGVALEIITGGSGLAQQAIILGGQLTQLRHTRAQEARADAVAADVLEAAGLDPAALARALEAIERDIEKRDEGDAIGPDPEERDYPSWLKSHPNTAARAEAAKARARPGGTLPLTPDEWAVVKSACGL